ncbi:hypothetical protein [uncultured Bacteroides sp.]|uniref:hypothetical protein n=1 Tax=uncultured Bacteroides sp. TaxID=162156 RepID=UPI0025F69C88|nr:hypothetical protein [uncultured Bacteroides sp.]
MKQMKFFLVALMTVVMSVSVTSCMNGDDNTIRQREAIAKCISTYPPTFQFESGQKFVVDDMSLLTLETGSLYYFIYEFDSAEQDENSSTLNVKIISGAPSKVDADVNEGPTNITESTKANAPLFTFNADLSTQPFDRYDQQYIVIPVVYWVKVEGTSEDQKKEFDKHSFILTYDEDEIGADATELVLTLNHVINTTGEENVTRDRYTATYKAYRLDYALSAFSSKTGGKKPTKITIKAKVNASRNDLSGATDATPWTYTFK